MSKQRHLMAVASHLLLRDRESGEILFLRRANTGYADGCWSVPAGHVEVGETLVEACVREAAEEIGVWLTVPQLTPVLVQHKHDTDGQERIDVFFLAELPADARPEILEPDHCDGLRWAPIDKPPTPAVAYVGAALETIAEGKTPLVSYFGFPCQRGLP